MTVLQRDTATGFGPRGKQVIIGIVMVVVGLGAAYGISQLVTDSAGTAHAVLAERSARMNAQVDVLTENAQAQAKALEQAAVMQQMTEQAQIQERLLDAAKAAQTSEWTLDDELAVLQGRADANTGVSVTDATQTSQWSLDDELDAIRGNQRPASTTPTHQPAGPQ